MPCALVLMWMAVRVCCDQAGTGLDFPPSEMNVWLVRVHQAQFLECWIIDDWEIAGKEEKAWYQQIVGQTVESTHLKRYATLDEQAAPILFLASDEASYIVGSTLPVGGGDLG